MTARWSVRKRLYGRDLGVTGSTAAGLVRSVRDAGEARGAPPAAPITHRGGTQPHSTKRVSAFESCMLPVMSHPIVRPRFCGVFRGMHWGSGSRNPFYAPLMFWLCCIAPPQLFPTTTPASRINFLSINHGKKRIFCSFCFL